MLYTIIGSVDRRASTCKMDYGGRMKEADDTGMSNHSDTKLPRVAERSDIIPPLPLSYATTVQKPMATRWRVAGVLTKRVTCEKCRSGYRYELRREVRSWSYATPLIAMLVLALLISPCVLGRLGLGPLSLGVFIAFGVSLRRLLRMAAVRGAVSLRNGNDAALSANKRLKRELEASAEPVACPKCGWYQRDMVAEVRARAFGWVVWLVPVVLIATPLIGFAAWRTRVLDNVNMLGIEGKEPYLCILLVAATTLAVIAAVAAFRWMASLTIDPNRRYPASPEPYPDSPAAILEQEWAKRMADQTARITSIRRPNIAPPATPPRTSTPRP